MKYSYTLVFGVVLSASFLSACLNRTDKEKGQSDIEPAVAPLLSRDSTKFTTIEWLDSSKSLGTIEEGQILKVNFRFKNAGKNPLVLEKVQPACGCTVADYPKTPITPGNTGEIIASFDSKGREGQQNKTLTVFANTPENTHTLLFDVMVKKK
jgi:hypothetical protein